MAPRPRVTSDEPRLVIHIEDHAVLREAVRVQVESCAGVRYTPLHECTTDVPAVDPLLGFGEGQLAPINFAAAGDDPDDLTLRQARIEAAGVFSTKGAVSLRVAGGA